MKYVEITSRNVYFIPTAEAQISTAIKNAANNNVVKWIKSNFRNWLINKAPLPFLLKSKAKSAPDWVKKKIDTEQIYVVNPTILRSLKYKDSLYTLDHIVDYLNTRTDNVSNMAVDEVLRQVELWDERLKKQELSEDGLSKVIYQYDTGYKWVQLLDEKALKYEGANMSHCVGGYWDKVKSKECIIYSLRDAKNIPHITVEFDRKYKQIIQVQGKSNKPVKKEYRSYFLDFVNARRIKLTTQYIELSEYGFISYKYKGKYFIMDVNYTDNNKDLPKGIILPGLTFDSATIPQLPNYVTIDGNLDLENCDISSLPIGLTVEGHLDISNTKITEIPKDCKVNGVISAKGITLKIPDNYSCNVLYISNSTVIPSTLKVAKSLEAIDWKGALEDLTLPKYVARDCNITKFNNCTFSNDCMISKCKIKNFSSATVLNKKDIEIINCDISFLSEVKIKGQLFLGRNTITKAPQLIICDRLEMLGNNELTELPILKVKRLVLNSTSFKFLPEGSVIGHLEIRNLRDILTIPKNIKIKQITCIPNSIDKIINKSKTEIKGV